MLVVVVWFCFGFYVCWVLFVCGVFLCFFVLFRWSVFCNASILSRGLQYVVLCVTADRDGGLELLLRASRMGSGVEFQTSVILSWWCSHFQI